MPADQRPSPWVQAAISGLAALHPPGGRIRYTVMLFNPRLFVDDTGTHDGATFCGAAGYLFAGDDADAFSQEWCDALPPDLCGPGFGFSRFVRDVQRGYRDPEALRPLVDVLRRRAR